MGWGRDGGRGGGDYIHYLVKIIIDRFSFSSAVFVCLPQQMRNSRAG